MVIAFGIEERKIRLPPACAELTSVSTGDALSLRLHEERRIGGAWHWARVAQPSRLNIRKYRKRPRIADVSETKEYHFPSGRSGDAPGGFA